LGADEHGTKLPAQPPAATISAEAEAQRTVMMRCASRSISNPLMGKTEGMSEPVIRERDVHVNGITLHVLEAGDPAGQTVILSHGFPEGAYSWRHQLPALAAAGYHVIAPDQRGYGFSSAPPEVDAYGIRHLTDDLNGLLDEAGKKQAVFVGHDWGSMIVWEHARMHPERVKAVVGVSVPLVQWQAPPIQMLRTIFADNFFYMVYFQEIGPADAELGADPYETMSKILWVASGEGFQMPTGMSPAAGTGFLTNAPTPPALPWAWLTEADVQHYAKQFAHSGFFGPLSYYRNMDANYEANKHLSFDRISMPSFFIGGTHDMVTLMDPTGPERMRSTLSDYRGEVIIDGAGHWTQQEKPDQFNEALIGFLNNL
jgi:pimeloyl-ACP methyl ester carboxylesterase